MLHLLANKTSTDGLQQAHAQAENRSGKQMKMQTVFFVLETLFLFALLVPLLVIHASRSSHIAAVQ